jgi:hypothetical protein
MKKLSLIINLITERIVRYPVEALVWLTTVAMRAHRCLCERIIVQIRENAHERLLAEIDRIENEKTR